MSFENIKIVYSADDNYVLPLCCSIKSVQKNTDNYVEIYVLYNKKKLKLLNRFLIKLLENKKCKISFCSIDENKFKNFTISNECYHTSIETYYRYLLPSVFYDTEKIIYLDCDTIVLTDIKLLYDININDNYIYGVKDFSYDAFCERLSLTKYVNAGVLLFNLDKMRKENIQDKLFEYTVNNIHDLPFQDQDVLNKILQSAIGVLEPEWNVQIEENIKCSNLITDLQNVNILHYISKPKPWEPEYKSINKYYFFDELRRIPFIIKLFKYYPYVLNKKRKSIIFYQKSAKVLVLFRKLRIKFF